jgi:hypothetical protein
MRFMCFTVSITRKNITLFMFNMCVLKEVKNTSKVVKNDGKLRIIILRSFTHK